MTKGEKGSPNRLTPTIPLITNNLRHFKLSKSSWPKTRRSWFKSTPRPTNLINNHKCMISWHCTRGSRTITAPNWQLSAHLRRCWPGTDGRSVDWSAHLQMMSNSWEFGLKSHS